MQPLTKLLQRHQAQFKPVLPAALQYGPLWIMSYSENNREVMDMDWQDAAVMWAYTRRKLYEQGAVIDVGLYRERRFIYSRHDLYQKAESDARCVHLGMDLGANPGTVVMAPLDAVVHSCCDNAAVGDYGPTVILKHQLDGMVFHTLYGHLARQSLVALKPGLVIRGGDSFALVGNSGENGGWPPHLHFQIIHDIGKWQGDYPGVVTEAEEAHYIRNCPDPNLILGMDLHQAKKPSGRKT